MVRQRRDPLIARHQLHDRQGQLGAPAMRANPCGPERRGVWPLVSIRNAEFLANEVPGVVVPENVLSRMRVASGRSREHAVAEGIAIARDMVAALRGRIQGVQVSAPFGKVDLALQVLDGAS